MIVEIVGLPGAGKTTAVTALGGSEIGRCEKLVRSGEYDALNRDFGETAILRKWFGSRWITLAGLARRRPRLAMTLVFLTVLHGRPLLRRWRKAQRVMAHVAFTERLQVQFHDRIVVHHDGFTQCLWSMLIDARKLRGQAMVRRIMRDYYQEFRPWLIILDLSDAESARRVFSRTSTGRFNQNSSKLQREQYSRWLNYHREIMKLVPEDLEIVVHLDATSPSESVARNLMDTLSGLADRAALDDALSGGASGV